ncbi:MAG: Lrp/AsnC family transcriptional regulator [Thermoplasmata archaeon]
MDEKDKIIVNLLHDNSRISNTEIAKVLNVSEGTIRKRIRKLSEAGVIKKFTIETSQPEVDALVLLKIDSKRYREVLKKINLKYPEIYEFTGKIDVALRIKCNSIDELNSMVDEIREIEGIIDTDTLVRLK